MNMSYCKFQNARTDLQDCTYTLDELLNEGTTEPGLSPEELLAMKNMIDIAGEFIEYAETYLEELGD